MIFGMLFGLGCCVLSILAYHSTLYLCYKYNISLRINKMIRGGHERINEDIYKDSVSEKVKLLIREKNKGKLKIEFDNDYRELIVNMKEYFLDDNWFFNKYYKWESENEEYDNDGFIVFTTDEDYLLVKTIFETVKTNKLMLCNENKNINMKYMKYLCEKWSCTQEIIDLIEEKIKLDIANDIKFNNFSTIPKLVVNTPFKCINCGAGFTLFDNKEGDCKCHKGLFKFHSNTFDCCGRGFDEPCIIGKHVPILDDNLKVLL